MTVKISALTAASTLAGTEVLPVVQGGNTVKATVAQMTAAATTGRVIDVPTPSSGRYLNSGSTVQTTFATGIGYMRCRKIWVPQTLTFDRIACSVTAGGTAGAVVRLGIYNDDSNGLPSTLILDAGTVASTTTGVKEITISQTLAAGSYWLAEAAQVAGCTLTADTSVNGFFFETSFNTGSMVSIEQSSVTGALPATWTGTSKVFQAPRIMLRVQ